MPSHFFKRLLIVAWCLGGILLTDALTAQTIRLAEGQHNFDYYTVEDGLAQSAIECIFQDSRGYIWFGTHGGVSRFDGQNFKTFTDKAGLLNYRVLSITEDRQGNMWFGTTNGLSKFDGASFVAYTTKNGLPYNFVRSLLVDREGNLWVGTNKLISYSSHNNTKARQDSTTEHMIFFKNYEVVDKGKKYVIGAMMQDKASAIWFGGWFGGLYKYDPNGTAGDTIIQVSSLTASHGLVEDDDGNIWCASWSGSLTKYNPKGKAGENITRYALHTPQTGLIRDTKGNIWIATFEGGIFKYDGQSFVNYTTSAGLPINATWSIMQDREGLIWVGTFGGGVCKYNGERFIYFNESVGLVNNTVNGITEDRNGNIWFCTEVGISKYTPKSLTSENNGFTNFTSVDGLPINRITGIAEDKNGDIWFSHDMARREGYQFHNNELITVPFNGWMCVYEDHSGKMWFGSGDAGPYTYDGKKKVYFKVEGGMNPNRIICIFEDKNHNMWFGTYGGGANVFNGDTTRNISDKEGFTDKMVYTIIEDQEGLLWFGTDGDGIYKGLFLNGETFSTVDTFTTYDGLSNNIVQSLVFDNDGNLWAGTTRGIDKLDINHYNETGKKRFKHYGVQEGFRGLECTSNICIDKNNNLWFGTTKGAIKYNPRADVRNKERPLTHITNLLLFQKGTDWSQYSDTIDSKTGLPFQLSLAYDKNHLTFEYIGISFTIPEKVRYRYMLEGFDKDWSPVTDQRQASYSNLDPGSYTFKVEASNNDGLWNKKPTTFAFIIAPPYWETTRFYSLQLMFFMVLIGGTAFVSRRGKSKKVVTILVYISLFVVFEFIQNLCEPLYEDYVGSAPIIKTLLNLILASTLLPVQLFLRKFLRGKQKPGKVEDDLI